MAKTPRLASGNEVHCVTNRSESIKRTGAFNPAIDVVMCFDTIAEADEFFYRQHPDFVPSSVYQHNGLDQYIMVGGEQYAAGCGTCFVFYSQTGFTGNPIDIFSSIYNFTYSTWSIQEVGSAAIRVWTNTGYSGVSWTIGESHWYLGNGWGGYTIDSIQWL